MNDEALASRLREVLAAAHHRYRTQRSVLGALTTVPIPAALLDHIATSAAPLLQELVDTAVDARLASQYASDQTELAAVALRRRLGKDRLGKGGAA